MECQKLINLVDNKSNQLSKFKKKNWAEINDDANGTYNTSSQIKFKTSVLKSSLCDYSNAHILVSRTKTVPNTGTEAVPNNLKNKIVKNYVQSTDSIISEINNTQIDNAKDIVTVMPIYSLIEYSDNYSKYLNVYGNTIEMNHF